MNSSKYLWLYENFRMYEYISEEAKQLKDRLSSIDMSDSTNIDEHKKLEELYDLFVKIFDNNVYNYSLGINTSDIRCDNIDGFFIEYGSEVMPIGYFRQTNPYECKIMIENMLVSQASEISDMNSNLKNRLKSTGVKVTNNLEKVSRDNPQNVPKLNRGLISLVSGIMVLLSCICYLIRIKIWTLSKYIVSPTQFVEQIKINYDGVPFFDGAGFIKWIIAFIIVILLVVYGVKLIVFSKSEIIRALNWMESCRLQKRIADYILYNEKNFDNIIKVEGERINAATASGENVLLTKNEFALKTLEIIKKENRALSYLNFTLKRLDINLFKYYKRSSLIKQIVIMVLAICVLGYAANPINKLERKVIYNVNKGMHNITVKVDDYYVSNVDSLDVYSRNSIDSRIKINIADKWTPVIVLEEKENKKKEKWTKIIYDDGERFVKGWVVSRFITKYYGSDVFDVEPIEVTSFDTSLATANLGKLLDNDKGSYVSTQDKSVRISMGFNGVRQQLAGISFYPGYGGTEEQFKEHARVSSITIKTEDKEIEDIPIYDYGKGPQTILFNKPILTSNCTITVKVIRPGSEDNIIYIGECKPLAYMEKSE